MKRRDLLLRTGGLAGLGALGGFPFFSRPLRAEELNEDRYFIFCFFDGGWDLLLSLDPREPALYPASAVNQTGIQLDYDRIDGQLAYTDGTTNPNGTLLRDLNVITTDSNGTPFADPNMRLGPAIGNMRNHTDHIAIINGMSMNTLNHTVGKRYFLTGRPPIGLNANGSSMATWLAYVLGESNPIPNLVFNVESYNQNVDVWASGMQVNSVSDLITFLAPGEYALSPGEEMQIEQLLQEFASREESIRSSNFNSAAINMQGAKSLIDYGYNSLMDLSANTSEMAAMRTFFNVNPNDLGTAEAQAAAACLAVTNKVSRSVSIRAAFGLDTHFQNWADFQAMYQQQGWNIVARIMDYLKSVEYEGSGSSWLEHTTIVCTSDFSRTPRINPSGGRDHHLLGSCLLAGAGIKPGVYGASTDVSFRPYPMDIHTGLTDPGGETILPDHIARTLLTIAGVEDDITRLRVDPLHALLS